MFRTVTFITLVASIIAGIILNITAAVTSGKNLFELATMNDMGVFFMVWGQYPLASLIITALVAVSGITLIATQK